MFAKALLLSVVVMLVAVPVMTARMKNPRRGLKRALVLTVALNVLYLLAVRYVYPHLI